MIEEFRARILERKPLRIRGGGSKDFYGGPLAGERLDTTGHAGIVSYEPSELVITARCGTPLAEIKSALALRRQCLAFEPPDFGASATLGGVVAAGLSGTRRVSAGSVRDFVLGVTIMDGEGRLLKFGGEVMKNVAGFDVSRLMTGGLGTLGLILEVSLKVLPLPAEEVTLCFDLPQDKALVAMNHWAGQPLPLAASCWQDGSLSLRLMGAQAAVHAACVKLGGERLERADAVRFWSALREQRLEFFAGDAPVWRLSLPPATPPPDLPASPLIEWHGAQRWLRGEFARELIVAALEKAGAGKTAAITAFRGGDRTAGVFASLPPALMQIHRRLKHAFDPHGIFNPGRLYPEL